MKHTTLDVAVIGGGAAGFFAAIRIAEYRPGTRVLIFEKTSKLLSKVAISGGGRCNVTHDPDLGISQMAAHYPRGERLMKRLLKSFDQRKMWDWLSSKGVALKVEADGRVFPQSNKSQSIITCFLNQCEASHIEVKTREGEVTFQSVGDGFEIKAASGMYHASTVVVARGGGNKA